MGSGVSSTGLILVLLFIFIGLGLLLQLFYVLWYRRRFRQRSAGDSELASIISDRSGTPVSKELALYFLYYRNQLPSSAAIPDAEAASTSQPMGASAPAVDAAVEAMQEAVPSTMSMPPPPPPAPEEAAGASEDEEYEQNPAAPSFSRMVRDFAAEDDRETTSVPPGGARSTSRYGAHGRRDATPPTSPPPGSPVGSPEREVVEFKRYARKAARRVALPS